MIIFVHPLLIQIDRGRCPGSFLDRHPRPCHQVLSDAVSTGHGQIAATEYIPGGALHIRGDTLSGLGDSGGGVFSKHTGKVMFLFFNSEHRVQGIQISQLMEPLAAILRIGIGC